MKTTDILNAINDRLVKAGRACRQLVPPNLRRRGNQSQQHLTACQFGEFFYRRQILLHLRRLRLLHLSDERIAAEIDTVKFSLPQQQLTPGLQSRPVVPQGELVSKIVLYPRGKAAVFQGFPGKVRELGQRPVFRFRARPVRQRNVPYQQSR